MAAAFSALGIAASDVLETRSKSDPMPLPASASAVNALLDSLRNTAVSALEREHFKAEDITVVQRISMRYRRQIHNEVWITVPNASISDEDLERAHESFRIRYEELYGKGSAY